MDGSSNAGAATDADRAAGARPEAIFVVGVSRSGTTLLRRILDSHSQVAIATENHYLGHLLAREGARRYFARLGDPHDEDGPQRLAAFLTGGGFQGASRFREVSPFWRWVAREVSCDELEARFRACDRSERGIFAALLRCYADHRGKAVMGEKTPSHLAWAPTLIDWFPGCRIVHVVRDPRAVYASELRRRTEVGGGVPYHQLRHAPPLLRAFVLHEVAWAWAGAVHQHRRLAAGSPDHYRCVRFEDVVRTPAVTLAALVDWIGIPWEDGLLHQRVYARGVNHGTPGFDASSADRWRSEVSGPEDRWLRELLGARLSEMGYAS
jgi:hypothetical protein